MPALQMREKVRILIGVTVVSLLAHFSDVPTLVGALLAVPALNTRFPLTPGRLPRLNFFAVAIDGDVINSHEGYERFLIPYAAFALHAQRESVAELVVSSAETFQRDHAPALAVLARVFPGRVVVREPGEAALLLAARLAQAGWRAMVRFLDAPRLRANVTLIGDVDIMTLAPTPSEDFAAEHLAHMRAFLPALPYSNIVRPHKTDHRGVHAKFNHPRWRHLTGRLHAVETDAFYGAPAWAEAVEWFSAPEAERDPERAGMLIDEVALQLLCARAFGLPERKNLAAEVAADPAAAQRALTWSPTRGIHLSPARGRGKVMLNVASCRYCRAAATVARLAWFAELLTVSPDFTSVQAQINELCACCVAGSPDDKECAM